MNSTDNLALYLGIGLTALAAISVIAMTSLRAFTGWIDLKRAELGTFRDSGAIAGARLPGASARIDIADLKERIRKLEAIAAGVEF
jgi:hypothetical protein